MRINNSYSADTTRCNKEEHRAQRCNRIFKGINHIISISLQGNTKEELINTCLSAALEITDSQVGFIGEVDFNGLLHEVAVSNNVGNQCNKYDKSDHQYPHKDFILNGLYGCVIENRTSFLTNCPLSCLDNICMPHGHPSLTSFLGAPLLVKGKAIGMLAVANREGGYSRKQLEDLEAIVPAVTQALRKIKEEYEHKQDENALLDAYEQIQVQSDELQMQSDELQIKDEILLANSNEIHSKNYELRVKSEELQQVNNALEEKVKQRTAELEEAYSSLKESEKGLADAQKMAHVGSWDRDILTNKLYWSNEVYSIFGFKPQEFEVTYDLFLNYVHPDDRDYVNNAVKRAIDGEPYDIDYRIILPDGSECVVHSHGEIVYDEKNYPIRIRGTNQDITKRKKAEEALKLSNSYNRSLIETSLDTLVTIGPDGKITDVNAATEKVTGYSRNDLIGTDFSNYFTEPEKAEEAYQHVFQEGSVRDYSLKIQNKHGKVIPILYNATILKNEVGETIGVFAAARDISGLKKVENSLAQMEKIRIKEIHHRIKNNLQVISSLLDLQAEKFEDLKVVETFRESQNRVISMSLIHEELYKGGEIDKLNFSAYLQKLARNLFQTYILKSNNIRLNMDLEDNAFLDMDIAVPLGIIVNELVSNSLKHAFTENPEGEIRIRLCREERNKETQESLFSLIISDNGKGIPEDLEIENVESLGLQLVRILVDQLDGELELKRNKGTELTVRFAVPESNNTESAESLLQLADND